MANSLFKPKTVVLVVEDDVLVRMTAADALEDAGFLVLEAADADEAVRILETRLDVRLVFTDIDMPGSMDGIKLAAAIRGRWPPIRVLVTSGHHDLIASELPERCMFIPKPYRFDQIVDTLRRMAA